MSLKVWLPLNGDLYNQGLSNITITNNGATVNNNGKIGKCYSFNGSSQYIQINTIEIDLNNVSFCGWIKWNSLQSWSRFFDFGYTTSGGGAGLLVANSGYSSTIDISGRLYGGNWFDVSIPNFSIQTGEWYHLTVTISNNVCTFYINGQQKHSFSVSGSSGVVQLNYNYLGKSNWSSDAYFDGNYNDFRIYNHCLTPSEVKEISKGLVAHYTLGSASVLEATTNLLSVKNWDTGSASWGGHTWTVTNENFVNAPITTGTKLTVNYSGSGGGGFYAHLQDLNVQPSTTYTFSEYIKSSTNEFSTLSANALYRYEYNSSTYVTETGLFDSSRIEYVGNSWYRIWGTFTTSSTTNTLYLYFYSYDGRDITYCLGGPQLEQHDHMTPYVFGSRLTGIVYDSSGYCRNLTITGSVSPADTVRYDKSLYLPNQNIDSNYLTSGSAWSPSFITTGSVSFWCKFNGVGSYGWLPFTGQDGSYYIMATSYGSGGFYHSNIGSPVAIYRDGVIVSAPSDNGNWHHYCITGVNMSSWSAFKVDEYGGGWNSNMCISDLRLYNTVLSADDVKDLYNLGASIS